MLLKYFMWYPSVTEALEYAFNMPSSISNYWPAAGHANEKDIGHETIKICKYNIFLSPSELVSCQGQGTSLSGSN